MNRISQRSQPVERAVKTPRLTMQASFWDGLPSSDESGFGANNNWPTIVLIHPNRTSHRVWDFVIEASALPNPFVAPALRGHAGSDWPASGYRLEDHRDDLISFIELTEDKPVILVGQATGATLALMIGCSRPQMVTAVIAAQPAVGIASAVNSMVQSQVAAQTGFSNRDEARQALPFADYWTQQIIEHYLDHALMTLADGTLVWRYSPDGVCETEAELQREVLDQMAFTGKCLIFGGAHSTVLPPAMFERVADALPQSHLANLPHANHRLSQDNPNGFAVLMDRFVQSL